MPSAPLMRHGVRCPAADESGAAKECTLRSLSARRKAVSPCCEPSRVFHSVKSTQSRKTEVLHLRSTEIFRLEITLLD